jgi:NADH-quinone oxidoreductase subunit N
MHATMTNFCPILASLSSRMMTDKLSALGPEVALVVAAVLCLALGLARQSVLRKLSPLVAAAGLLAALGLTLYSAGGGEHYSWANFQGSLPIFVKIIVSAMGLILLLSNATLPTEQPFEHAIEQGRSPFSPADVMRGEFLAFFLLSLTGVMLCAGADDLIWLFLALELTSLPTYVMVVCSRAKSSAQEAAVKYFFLGAAAAAIFLYGFALIYGATGFTSLPQIHTFVSQHRGNLPPLLIAGVLLAIVGISFKIAAFPMHFYAADVYQGAASPVTAFLAFVPKTAGFVSLILLLSTLGWPLPAPVGWILWISAAATMTIGNVMGVLQTNVKRALGYSSVAHSGYMLVALLAGPLTTAGPAAGVDGIAAVLFYLVGYGLANVAAFSVLGSLKTNGQESEDLVDISGLVRRQPGMASVLLLSMFSLIGLPPLVGFTGKIFLFSAAISHNDTNPAMLWLVVIGVINSAIAAVYYLRIAGAAFFGEDNTDTVVIPGTQPREAAAAAGAVLAVALGLAGGWLVDTANDSTTLPQMSPESQTDTVVRSRRSAGTSASDTSEQSGSCSACEATPVAPPAPSHKAAKPPVKTSEQPATQPAM